MNRINLLIWLLAAMVVTFAAAPVYAQDTSSTDGVRFTIAPYILAPSMNGNMTLRGIGVDVGVGPTDIFDNLKFGFMGYAELRTGRWGFAFDSIYMNLERGAQVGTIFGPVGARASVRQGMYEFTGQYRAAPWIDLLAGVRINHVSAEYEVTPGDLNDDESRTWADPLVGVRLQVPDTGRWLLAVRADIGGFGIGSKLAWQVYPTVGYAFSDLFTLAGGYRYLDMDYETGQGRERFAYDIATSGPFVGFAFKF